MLGWYYILVFWYLFLEFCLLYRHNALHTVLYTPHNYTAKLLLRYETSAHLWLVLEYCVGGDLLTLLRQVCFLILKSRLVGIVYPFLK